ncbi:hypothetical protein Y032_0035g2988 [Ancylostoma ceylanicum]|uniref:Uncharacterized protein n=1 Tax=Ancylostoma ceylanicum TaxID=53326 RepID=A0A016ULV3_9BILA|nr:hypothetical protein Y032_0035g2988 [Ancylostoma ceylanicum]
MMSSEAKALIAKLHHAVSKEPQLAYREIRRFPNDPHFLNVMPADINEWMNSHHVMRLSTILETLDRKPIHQIPSHRILAYCYDLLYAAEFVINGEKGERVMDHLSAVVRTDLDSTSMLPTYDENISYTVGSRMETGLANPHAPLLQLDFGGADTFYVLEQLWIVLEKEPIRALNPWELVRAEPQYIPNRPLTPTDNEESDYTDEEEEDGVYSDDEDNNNV